jgi:excinuclease UvrABC ATPase subunit
MSMATRTETHSPALHVADSHDLIRVQGARENNLKDVSVEIPKRRLTVFTGISGSGKSSLVFGTIAAESQRLINETYSAFVQGFMPTLARPEVDLLEGLTTAIIVDQERMGANSRSTVGTATDANAMLRIVFSRLGEPSAGPSFHYSFNLPAGACPRCEGMGSVTDIDLTQLYDERKSLAEGAITIPGYTVDGWMVRIFSASGFVDPDKPIRDYTETELHDFLHREPTKVKVNGVNLTYDVQPDRGVRRMIGSSRSVFRWYFAKRGAAAVIRRHASSRSVPWSCSATTATLRSAVSIWTVSGCAAML